MAEKYHKFDENGRVIAKYSRFQNIPGLEYIEEAPFSPARRVNGEWIEDVEVYGKEKIIDAESLASSKFLLSSKKISAIETQFDVFRNSASGWASFSDVDKAFDDFLGFLDVREPIE
jgi:hypothetical protein